MLLPISLLLQFVMLNACQKASGSNSSVPFDSIPAKSLVTPMVTEVSGIADSRKNKGFVWAQEDSGNPSLLYLISHTGAVAKTIFLKGIVNRDWEDLGLYGTNIYLAETGDNNESFSEYAFYKFAEPEKATDTVTNIETIRFCYEDGPHDAEAFLVDEDAGHIYVITKRGSRSALYKIAYPYSSTGLNTARAVGQLPYGGVVSAAVAPGKNEILIKNYTGIFYYTKTAGANIEQALQQSYKTLPYKMEPQGEAITFAADNSGFFTLSEKGFSSNVNLYFYRRK